MSWTNKKTPGAIAQLKTAPGSKRPVAPPVYHPQPGRVVVQSKMSGRSEKKSMAPPVYRSQPVPKVLQRKSHLPAPPDISSRLGPRITSVSKPIRTVPLSPGIPRVPVAQCKIAAPGARGVIQRAEAEECAIHGVELVLGRCYKCDWDIKKAPKVAEKKVVVVTLLDFSKEHSKVSAKLLKVLEGKIIVHRGNKPPKQVLTFEDLINHGESSSAPVWFTVGAAATGADIEKYKYHHVLELNRSVNEIISSNMGQTMMHSESSAGEASWPGYLIKTNEPGCFGVSQKLLAAFYATFKKSHVVKVSK